VGGRPCQTYWEKGCGRFGIGKKNVLHYERKDTCERQLYRECKSEGACIVIEKNRAFLNNGT
jgi:hypothetical protein